MVQKIETLQKPHLIFCEGMDEKWFLIRFLNSAALSGNPFFSSEIQVVNFGGNEELTQKLEVLRLSPGFSEVRSLLIVRDAEQDGEAAVREIRHSLQRAELPVPYGPGQWALGGPRVGFLLFPTCDRTVARGTLEDLCLSLLEPTDRETMLEEIDAFLGHLQGGYQRSFPHLHKARLHTYFSITDRFVGMKIGEAAAAMAFDWKDPRLHFFRDFLLEAAAGGEPVDRQDGNDRA